MKAVIEAKEGMYLIRIYGSDGSLCDVYAVDNIHYCSIELKEDTVEVSLTP